MKVKAAGKRRVLAFLVVYEVDLGVGSGRSWYLNDSLAARLVLVEDVHDVLLTRWGKDDGVGGVRLLGGADEDHVVLHSRRGHGGRRKHGLWLFRSGVNVHVPCDFREGAGAVDVQDFTLPTSSTPISSRPTA